MLTGREQLSDWMTRRGFNQTEAADFFGWDETFVGKIVNGHRSPGLVNAVRIERMTGIPVEAWVDETDSSLDQSARELSTARGKRRQDIMSGGKRRG